MELRNPKDITITDKHGKERKFTLHDMSAWDGLEFQTRMPANLAMLAVPKIGDWETVKELALIALKYVTIESNGVQIPLASLALIDNHTGDAGVLRDLLIAEAQHDNRFFRKENLSAFFAEAFQMALAKISETLTQSSEQSSTMIKPHSTN